jgi:indolepyruvate ferredoxin oxidoreductase beta subunit
MDSLSVLLSGVGGQGTLLASNIVAEVGLEAGFDVKKSEVHGMAQRGGSVSSHVRWGHEVHSPLIGLGRAEALVAFEQIEALRYLDYLRPGGKALINDHIIVPVTVTTGNAVYPSKNQLLQTVRQVTDDITLVPGVEMAESLGNARVNNVVLLGVLSQWIGVEREVWERVIARKVPPRYIDLNISAFAVGREYADPR